MGSERPESSEDELEIEGLDSPINKPISSMSFGLAQAEAQAEDEAKEEARLKINAEKAREAAMTEERGRTASALAPTGQRWSFFRSESPKEAGPELPTTKPPKKV